MAFLPQTTRCVSPFPLQVKGIGSRVATSSAKKHPSFKFCQYLFLVCWFEFDCVLLCFVFLKKARWLWRPNASVFICNSEKLRQLLKIRWRILGPPTHSTLKFNVHLVYRENHKGGGRKNLSLKIIIRKEIKDWLLTCKFKWLEAKRPEACHIFKGHLLRKKTETT